MCDRYFSQTPISTSRAILAGAEAHHLIHVMRAKPGARIVLFDGSGVEFLAEVQRVGRADVELAVLERRDIDRESPLRLSLGVALPKGDRQKWLVEKAVELGVAQIVPLVTARSVARPATGALERLSRIVVEASKQCGRNRLLEIARPCDWAQYISTATASCRLVAHPDTKSAGFQKGFQKGSGAFVRSALRAVPAMDPDPYWKSAVVAIGPEGGFTDEEISQAIAAGWQPIDLGPRILRVETAAIVVAARLLGPHQVHGESGGPLPEDG